MVHEVNDCVSTETSSLIVIMMPRRSLEIIAIVSVLRADPQNCDVVSQDTRGDERYADSQERNRTRLSFVAHRDYLAEAVASRVLM